MYQQRLDAHWRFYTVGYISTGWKKGVNTMLLIEADHCPAWGKTLINAAMIQSVFVADNNVNANIIDTGEYTARIARFYTKEQTTDALERLVPYLGKSGDGIIRLSQWTGKE